LVEEVRAGARVAYSAASDQAFRAHPITRNQRSNVAGTLIGSDRNTHTRHRTDTPEAQIALEFIREIYVIERDVKIARES
jgi:hypothetical protein